MNLDDVPKGSLGTCRSCNRPVIWAVTTSGSPIPVEREQGAAGNLALAVQGGRIQARVVPPKLAFGNQTLHVSHFVACPQARTWRRGRRRVVA